MCVLVNVKNARPTPDSEHFTSHSKLSSQLSQLPSSSRVANLLIKFFRLSKMDLYITWHRSTQSFYYILVCTSHRSPCMHSKYIQAQCQKGLVNHTATHYKNHLDLVFQYVIAQNHDFGDQNIDLWSPFSSQQ